MKSNDAAPREMCEARFYLKLASAAPNPTARDILMSLAGDEYARTRVNAAASADNPPAMSCPVGCDIDTDSYESALEGAIKRELTSAVQYALAASRAPTRTLRNVHMAAFAEELAHARILTALREAET